MNKALFLFLLVSILFCNASPIKGESCPNDMVLVPAGELTKNIYIDQKIKTQTFYLDAFCIDKFEVYMKDYLACASTGICDLDLIIDTYLTNSSLYNKYFKRNKFSLLNYFFCNNPLGSSNKPLNSIYCPALNKLRNYVIKNVSLNIVKTENIPIRSASEKQNYCYFVGKRVPTKEELEKAEERYIKISPYGFRCVSSPLNE